jgi:hypothetical protein
MNKLPICVINKYIYHYNSHPISLLITGMKSYIYFTKNIKYTTIILCNCCSIPLCIQMKHCRQQHIIEISDFDFIADMSIQLNCICEECSTLE